MSVNFSSDVGGIDLPNPSRGITYTPKSEVLIRESMTGGLNTFIKIFNDTKKLEIINMQFPGLTQAKAAALHVFIVANLEATVTFTDEDGLIWIGQFIMDTLSFEDVRRNQIAVSIQFEGAR